MSEKLLDFLKLAQKKISSPPIKDPSVFYSRETFIESIESKPTNERETLFNSVKASVLSVYSRIDPTFISKFESQNNSINPVGYIAGLNEKLSRTENFSFKIDLFNHLDTYNTYIKNDSAFLSLTDTALLTATLMDLVEIFEILVRIYVSFKINQEKPSIHMGLILSFYREEGNLYVPHSAEFDQLEIPSLYNFKNSNEYKVSHSVSSNVFFESTNNIMVFPKQKWGTISVGNWNTVSNSDFFGKTTEIWLMIVTGLDVLFNSGESILSVLEKNIDNFSLYDVNEKIDFFNQLTQELPYFEYSKRLNGSNVLILPKKIEGKIKLFVELGIAFLRIYKNQIIIQEDVTGKKTGTRSYKTQTAFHLSNPLSDNITYLNYHATGYFAAIIVDAMINSIDNTGSTELKRLIMVDSTFLGPFLPIKDKGMVQKALFIDNNLANFPNIINWLNDTTNGNARTDALCNYIETTDGTKWKSFQQQRSNLSRFSQLNNYYQTL